MAKYTGDCHCGRIRLEFVTEREASTFVPRICGCGFCKRHGAVAVSDPHGHIVLYLPLEPPTPYRFGHKITDFHVCDRCGILVAATWYDADKPFGIINLPTLHERSRFDGTPITVDFDEEDAASREARRRANWTPAKVVELSC